MTYDISDKLLRLSQILEKLMEILKCFILKLKLFRPLPSVNFEGYWRVATPILVSRNCLRYLQAILIIGEVVLVT